MAEYPSNVEVVYALPERQVVVSLSYEAGMTAADAVRRSGLLEQFAEISAQPLVLGVFGGRVDEDYALRAGDRVEICRPLPRDPRHLRRELASRGAVMGRETATRRRG